MRLNHPNGGHRPPGISRARRSAALGLSVVALAAGASATGTAPATARPKAAPAAAPDCSAAYRIQQKLSNGTTWSMCWRFESKSGLVLEKVSYQPPGEARPIRVLNSAKLAQIHVPYDDGSNEYNDITDYNFGSGLVNMTPAECPGGTIKTVKVPGAYNSENPNVKGLCTTTRARGHAYRMQTDSGKVYQSQGKDLLVYTVNKVSWYEYITEWRFADDGTVSMNVGATGSLSPFDYDAGDGRGWPIGKGATSYSTSHNHNVF
jgi:primary-amine oxidase